jgi:hypothetical protein
MHIQIVSLAIEGITNDEWAKMADELAPAFAGVPGLISKVWLVNPETNSCCGGLYTWKDRQAMENYAESDLFNAVLAHPNVTNVSSIDYTFMEGPTRVTRGLVASTV